MVWSWWSDLAPKNPIIVNFCGMDHQKSNFSLIYATLSDRGRWGPVTRGEYSSQRFIILPRYPEKVHNSTPITFANFCFDKWIFEWSVESLHSNFKMSPLHIDQRFSLKMLIFLFLELNWNCCSSSWTGKTSLLSKSKYILLQTRYYFQKFETVQ